MKKIFHDGIVGFGKYADKHYSGEELARAHPDYVVWLISAEVAEVDDEVMRIISDWTRKNPVLYGKAARAGEGARKPKVTIDTTPERKSVNATQPAAVAYAEQGSW
jgi:hypothetical protein